MNEYVPCKKCRYKGKECCYVKTLEKLLNKTIVPEGCSKGGWKDDPVSGSDE